MDLQEKRKLDSERLAGQLAHVKARARPWRSIIALVLAVAAAVVDYEQGVSSLQGPGRHTARPITVITAVAFGAFAVGAAVGLSGKTRAVVQPRVGSAHAAVIRSCCEHRRGSAVAAQIAGTRGRGGPLPAQLPGQQGRPG